MIITITGKPCSGKGTAAKLFCEKYNFEYLCTGDMFRNFAQKFGYNNILTFQEQDSRIKEIDKLVDNQTIEIGKTKLNDNIVIDSRLAWHFIPNSFKVFINVSDTVAAQRLHEANRETEKTSTVEEAVQNLKTRWQIENERYLELYNTNNSNLNNYDYVIDSSNLIPEQIVEKIYENYINFVEKHSKNTSN